LGGKPTPGVGFAAGMERLIMVLDKLEKAKFEHSGPVLFIAALDERSREWAFTQCNELRTRGISAELDYLERSVKAQLREANRLNAKFVVVVGENELQSGSAKLKNMSTGEERSISLDRFSTAF